MKKVLGLVISERRLGNSELLVKEIMRNIPDPCERELIRLTDFQIEPCKACYSCLKPGTPCRMDDDFNFILNRIKAADALVIGLPVYVYGPHGYLKMLSDRLLGAGHYGEFTRDKPCVLAVSYGAQGCAGYARTAALAFPRLLQMKIVDCWQVHAALPGESVRDQKNLEHARNLGANLFSAPEFAKGPRECACCGADLFRLLPDGKIECPICSAVGRLNQDGAPDFSENVHYRFSEEAVREHFLGWLVGMKEKFIKEKDQLKEVQKPYREMDWWIKPATLRQG